MIGVLLILAIIGIGVSAVLGISPWVTFILAIATAIVFYLHLSSGTRDDDHYI